MVPVCFKGSTIVPVPKTASLAYLTDYCPASLTSVAMKCFERFFKAVNCREGKLVAKRRAYMMDDLELIGLDYLWRVRGFVATGAHKQMFLFIWD